MRPRTAVLALALALLAAPSTAHADPTPAPGASPLDAPGARPTGDRLTVGLQPATGAVPDDRPHFTYDLGPGGVRQDAVAVFNYSAKPVTLRLVARHALTTSTGTLDVAPTASTPRDVGAWIALASPSLTLRPRTRVIVPFQVGVPFDATPGDHTGAVVVALTTTSTSGDRRVDVENRVGLRVYLRVRGPVTPRLEVADVRARYEGSPRPSWRGPVAVSFTLRNTGNLRLGARSRIALTDPFGRVVARATVEDPLVLLPGSSVPVTARLDGVPAMVRLRAAVAAEPVRDDGGVPPGPVTASVTFYALPWLLVAAVALAGVAFAGRRAYRRRRPPRIGTRRRGTQPARHAAEEQPVALALLAGLTVAVAVLLAVVAVPAFAASGPWAATVTPASGADDTPIEVTTSGGCPAPATNVVARVFGAGLPAEGVNVVGNTAAGVRADRAFEVPLVVTLRDVAREQPRLVELRGRYRIDVVCRTARDPRPLGTYSAAVVFSSPTAWRADKPVSTVPGPTTAPLPGTGNGAAPGTPGGNGVAPGAVPGGGTVQGAAPGAPGAPGAAVPGVSGAPGTVVPGGTALSGGGPRGDSAGPSLVPLVLATLVAAALAASFAAGRRRGAPTPEGTRS